MEIDEKEFTKMSTKQQNLIIFQNTNKLIESHKANTKELSRIKFHIKVQYVVLTILTAGFTILTNMFFGHVNK